MRKALFLTAALGLLVTPLASAESKETYNLSGFSEIDVSAGVEVEFKTAEDFSVVADFRKGGPEDMKIRQDGDRLYISRKSTSGWGDRVRVTVYVTAPSLKGIEASSGSSVTATGIDAGDFDLQVSSGASAELSGKCDRLKVKASSGGDADAKDLKCASVSASASSGGSADAYASEDASSRTSSGGSVDIWGNPATRDVNDSISGGDTDFH